jgi:hypothetical protein
MHVLIALLTMAVITGFMFCALCVPFRVSLLLLITLCFAFTFPWIAVLFAVGCILWIKRDEVCRTLGSRHRPGRAKTA